MIPTAQMSVELRRMRERAEEDAALVEIFAAQLSETKKNLAALVSRYNERRSTLFAAILRQRKKTWCSRQRCGKVFELEDARWLWIEGGEKYDVEMDAHDVERFAHLERACPACQKSAAERHGWSVDGESFYSFLAEPHSDGWYALKSGQWKKCAELADEATKLLSEPPAHLVEEYAAEFGLGHRLEIKEDKLVVHETLRI